MGPIFGPGLLGGIEPCSFSSLLELVSELLLSTAGVWSAAPCPAQPSLQAPRSFISCLCASEWRMYCPCSLFISIIFMPFKKWKVWFKVKIFYRPFLIYNPSLLTFEWHFLWQNFYWITFGGSVRLPEPEREKLRYWRVAEGGCSACSERGDATTAAALLQNARCPDRVGLLIARKLDSSHHPMFSGFVGAIQCRLKKNEPLAFKCQISTQKVHRKCS